MSLTCGPATRRRSSSPGWADGCSLASARSSAPPTIKADRDGLADAILKDCAACYGVTARRERNDIQMDGNISSFLLQLLQIIWINILLSGDNAVVIALACRGLPPKSRTVGIVAGAGVAIVLRIIFTLVVVSLLAVPYLRIGGGILLIWIAVKLLTDEADESNVAEARSVWQAIRIVAIADMVMSLDNVLAIAAVAKDSNLLVIIGLG